MVDTRNLLVVASIVDGNSVEVVKFQLIDIASWLADENTFMGPIAWNSFKKSIYAKFFLIEISV